MRTVTIGDLSIEWEMPKWLRWLAEVGNPVYTSLGLDLGANTGAVVAEQKLVMYGIASLVAGAKRVTRADGSECEIPVRAAIIERLRQADLEEGFRLFGVLAELMPIDAERLEVDMQARQDFFEPSRAQQ